MKSLSDQSRSKANTGSGKQVAKRLSDERGQALVFAVLSMALLLGFVAFAVDVGTLFRAKRVMQIAADGAAIAGAAELNYGSSAIQTAGQAAATQNGIANGANGAIVTINNPTTDGSHTGAAYVEAVVSQSQPTFFMKIFNHYSMTVAARAVAGLEGSGGCIDTLGTTGTDFLANGNVDLTASNCGIMDDSSSSGALTVNGNVTISARSIGVVGGYSHNGNVSVSPAPITSVGPLSDPLAFIPAPSFSAGSCVKDPAIGGSSTKTLTQGCYDGLTINGNSSTTLSAGTYIINGNLTINGNASVSGTGGVTFYITNGGSVDISGNISLNLSAPTSGTYSGILFYQDRSDASAAAISGNSSSTIKGIVYFPSADVTFNGNSGTNLYTDFVVKQLTLNGNVSFQDYASLNGNTPLTAPRLVE